LQIIFGPKTEGIRSRGGGGENYNKRASLFALSTKCIVAIKPRKISEVGGVATMGGIKNGAQIG